MAQKHWGGKWSMRRHQFRPLCAERIPVQASFGGFRVVALLGIMSLSALPAQADGLDGLGVMLDAGYTHDYNLTNASAWDDKRSDNAASFNLDVSKTLALSEHTRLALHGLLDTQAFANYEGLDRLSLGVEGEFMYRTSGEFSAPTFGIVGSAGRDEFKSDLRKNDHYSAGITWRQPVTDRINLYAALKDNINHSDNKVFSVNYRSTQMNLDYGFSSGHTLYLSTEYRNGELVSTSGPDLMYHKVAAAWLDDDVFTDLTDYRVAAKTWLMRLGYNVPLAGKSSIDFSWRVARSTSDLTPDSGASAIRYVGNQLSIDYLVGF